MRAKAEFRIRSRSRTGDVHAFSYAQAFDFAAEPLDGSRCITAWGVRKLWQTRIISRTDVGLDGVDPSGGDPDKDLVPARFEVGHFLDAQDLRRAEFLHADRFHALKPKAELLSV